MSILSGATQVVGGPRLTKHILSGTMPELQGETVGTGFSRGLAAETFADRMAELVAGANTSRTARPCWHVHVDPQHDNPKANALFWDLLDIEFGLQNARACGERHRKGTRGDHEHRIFDLTRPDGSVINLRFERMRREKLVVRVAWELDLPLPPVPHLKAIASQLKKEGRHDIAAWVEGHPRASAPRSVAARSPEERQQGDRAGIDKRDVEVLVAEAWASADSGTAFVQALRATGLILAKGDAAVVVVDQAGEDWSLTRMVGRTTHKAGARIGAAAVKARIRGLTLPTLEEAKRAQRNARRARSQADAPRARPPDLRRGKGHTSDGNGDPADAAASGGRRVEPGGDGAGGDRQRAGGTDGDPVIPRRPTRSHRESAARVAEVARANAARATAEAAEAARRSASTAMQAAATRAQQDRHRQAAEVREALAAVDAEVSEAPLEVTMKRSAATAAGTALVEARSVMESAALRVAELEAGRPQGMRKAYAYLTGRLRQQDATLFEARAEAERTAQRHRARQVISDDLNRLASAAEAVWLADLEDDREGRRAELRERARWLDDAVTVLVASPDLAIVGDAVLTAAIRVHRNRTSLAEPATTLKPRGPR